MNDPEIRTLLALVEENTRLKSDQPLEDLWEVDDLARRYSVTPNQVRRWIKEDTITAFQLAGDPAPRMTRISDTQREIFEETSEALTTQGGGS